MDFHVIDPMQVNILIAAGLGSLVFLMVTRGMGWVHVISLFVVGQISAYYFASWMAMKAGWPPGVVSVLIGAGSFLGWGALIKVIQSLHDDPFGTVRSWWSLIRGNGGSGNNSGGGAP